MATDNNKNNRDEDAMIGSWLKRRLPDAPPQPWFTRTVMNRLPDRSQKIASIVEYVLYIIGIAASTAAAIRYFRGIESSGEATPVELSVLLLLIAMAGVMAYWLISPWVMPRR